VPSVVGIYDEPPPDGQDVIRSTRVADIGAIPLLRRLTRWRDEVSELASDVLGSLVP
jgi:hypothetical protein